MPRGMRVQIAVFREQGQTSLQEAMRDTCGHGLGLGLRSQMVAVFGVKCVCVWTAVASGFPNTSCRVAPGARRPPHTLPLCKSKRGLQVQEWPGGQVTEAAATEA